MSTAALMVLVVVIPASAASVLVMVLDLRAHRRRPPRRTAVPSRMTAAAGAALGVAGFGLTSLAGVAGLGHAATAASTKVEEVWVATATGSGAPLPAAPVPGQTSTISLPYAPVAIWGTGFDGQGRYALVAVDPSGGNPVTLLRGSWPKVVGEGVRPLDLVDPASVVAAARAAGILPANGVLTLELRTNDPPQRVLFTLPAAPPAAPAAGNARPGAARAAGRAVLPGGSVAGSVQLPAGSAPSSATEGSTAPGSAAPPATGGAASPGVGVPATGSGAALLGGLALLVSGGACAGLSLRLRRS